MKLKDTSAKALLLLFSLLVALAVAEVALRSLDSMLSKKDMPDYKAALLPTGPNFSDGGFLKPGFEGKLVDGYGGWVHWKNNSQGFRSNVEYSRKPPDDTLRILSLGDSFAVGYRVGQNKTYGYLLEQWLNGQLAFNPTQVLIAGAEHPTAGLYYLEHYGQEYHPDLLLLAITTGNDIAGVFARTGERGIFDLKVSDKQVSVSLQDPQYPLGFHTDLDAYEIPETCLSNSFEPVEKRLPWSLRKKSPLKIVEKVRQILYRTQELNGPCAIMSWYGDIQYPKLFDYASGLGFFLIQQPEPIKRAYSKLDRVLEAYKIFCEKRNIMLVVTLLPQRFQVQPGDWRETVRVFRLDPTCFDLGLPEKRIGEFCKANGIRFINVTDDLFELHAKTATNFYGPYRDMHWNREGHQAFYECIRGPLSSIVRHENLKDSESQ